MIVIFYKGAERYIFQEVVEIFVQKTLKIYAWIKRKLSKFAKGVN